MLDKRIVICNQEYKDSIKIGKLYFKGDFFESSGHCFFFKYFLYSSENTIEQYFEEYLEDKVRFVKELKGEFLLIDYNEEEDSLFFATDRLGKENAFIFNSDKLLCIANDFWEGISIIKPTEDDINWQAIKEMVIHNLAFKYDTIIKGYTFMPPASYAVMSLKDYEIKYSLYWKFKFHENVELTLDEAADKVYEIFDNMFYTIKNKFPEDTVYGTGLSGGWDSRLIAAFAKKHNMKLQPYCVGQKYSIYPFKTNGYKVVKKMQKYFDINNLVFIPYDSEDYIIRITDDVLLSPCKNSEYSISCRSKIPEFDVMINGEHGGVFFGEFDFENLLKYNKDSIVEYLLSYLSWNQGREMILDDGEEELLVEKIQDYINKLDTVDRHEIFYNFFFQIMSFRTKSGYFETIYNTKERYSPYLDPDFMDFFLTWDSKLFCNRVLQRRFFTKYFPQLSKMEDESCDAPLFWRNMDIKSVPYRLYYAAKNYIFKSSLRRKEWLLKDKDFKWLVEETAQRNRDVLKSKFPNLDIKKFYRINPRSTATLVKYLIEVDVALHSADGNRESYIKKNYSKK